MKQEQQRHYTTNGVAYQVAMPLNPEGKMPEDDSVRELMRIAEGIDWSKLSGAYERENSSWGATPKQMLLLAVLAFMNGVYSTRKIGRACRCDIRFMWLPAGRQVPDHTRTARFTDRTRGGIMEGMSYRPVHILREEGETEANYSLFHDTIKGCCTSIVSATAPFSSIAAGLPAASPRSAPAGRGRSRPGGPPTRSSTATGGRLG